MPRPAPPSLVVTFHKVAEPTPMAWWNATRQRGGRIRGGHMPIGRGRIPHDMGHLAVEAHLGLPDGFWGLLARGGSYRRGVDRRPSCTGRALVRDHRDELARAEALGNEHHVLWARGAPTPVGETFDRLAALWEAVPDGGSLTLRWPTLEVLPAPALTRR